MDLRGRRQNRARTNQLKRGCSTESEHTPKSKRTKTSSTSTPAKKRECIVCREDESKFPAVSDNCQGAHTNDVCSHCWGQHIRIEVEMSPPGRLPCAQCDAVVSREDLTRILSEEAVVNRYDYRIERATKGVDQGFRECLADRLDEQGRRGVCHNFQMYSKEVHGRVFECEQCGAEKCTECGKGCHPGERCDDFQARLEVEHGEEERKTLEAFRTTYWANPSTSTKLIKTKNQICPRCCARCDNLEGKRCPKVECANCHCLFCFICQAEYHGRGSVTELGNAVHNGKCRARKHKENHRFAKRRKAQGGSSAENAHTEVTMANQEVAVKAEEDFSDKD